ncbi:hypothetical protein CQ010_06400 [Arthrobacter sp. MYb211]|nr:hypothetical protein CIK76_10895 [Glutamicibacter sp. BW80]PRA00354.1 hypothetical protein CQ017_04820 [Arthrobacter sp. MYb224]PRA04546.1 hypothetical protein CQ019_09515 [Arthrobacter sp. MYb229]PRA12278.1 hypothetical protein CQ015_07095 [Arthrobacter sp. MYb221]PRB51542.1 hypothetical protein CQ013_07050 [Arthrobacter sp. MYb216]PRC08739.1 hypothetical protein CQ010_06400 [Arthrobacter sp. MYb211]
MRKSQRNVWGLIIGSLLLIIGVVLFTWYNMAVLTPAEIQRLEAGGSGENTAFESFALWGSPVLALAGAAIIAMAWMVKRKNRAASSNPQ